jgi:hypothetical protein
MEHTTNTTELYKEAIAKQLDLAPHQVRNLAILALFHRGKKPGPEFDMAQFATRIINLPDFEGKEQPYKDNLSPYEAMGCGTVCCLVGYGPKAGIPALRTEDWNHYMARNFGHGTLDDERMRWCFAAHWVDDPDNGAKRIAWMLEGKDIYMGSDNWYYTCPKYTPNWSLIEELAK